ncbi:MAG: winged helix-turn-helix transcriptional regulator [Candidatus Lokiarchaeota archaeon]|jgi:DNA-binding Lrp family transcriptional regulator|nr:winged helix-turn-helix transcriptional regulator [Candidatus Lokiarchaeota archaeon]TXT63017.1 MAG: HTH-type transcriptional regulator LysM (modular protein) [Candidatus Lokiarchaeota archaeon]
MDMSKKKKFNELLGIDDDDKKIIEMIEENPDITHSDIAKEIEKSQPAVGARIIKLERKHLLTKQVGFNIKKVDIKTAIVFISTKDVDDIVEKIQGCPFINHAFKISGDYNVLCFIAAADLQTIERLVDLCFRRDPNVLSVKTNILIDSIHDFVVPIDFQIEDFDGRYCGPDCHLKTDMPKFKFEQEEAEEPEA